MGIRKARNHNPTDPNKLRSLILRRSSVNSKTGCLEWWGYRTPAGYGHLSIGNKRYIVSRLMWEVSRGIIENGLHVLHKCDNPACVNIDHLFLGTPKDNSADKVAKGRARGGLAPQNTPILSFTDMKKIQADTRLNIEIAVDFKVSPSTIGRIKRTELREDF